MREIARKSFVATIVAVAVVAGAFALWQLKVLVALLLLAVVIASAMRPGVEWLHKRRDPAPGRRRAPLPRVARRDRPAALARRAPRARSDRARRSATSADIEPRTSPRRPSNSHGIKHEILLGLQHRLERLPHGTDLIHPAVTYGRTALEMLIGIFFVFAVAAYWIFEKERAQGLSSASPSAKNGKRIIDTWDLIDAKLGALRAWTAADDHASSAPCSRSRSGLIGLPYWLLIGVFAGLVEIVPVVGPLARGLVAIGVGLTVSWQTAAIAAAIAVYGFRLAAGLRDRPARARPRGRPLAAGRARHGHERRPPPRRRVRAARDAVRRGARDARRRRSSSNKDPAEGGRAGVDLPGRRTSRQARRAGASGRRRGRRG